MQSLLNFFTRWFYITRCFWVIAWRSVLVIMMSLLHGLKHAKQANSKLQFRYFINRHAHQGAVSILRIVKANYRTTNQVHDLTSLQRPIIFMSNHQSLFDLPLIFAVMPGTIRFIAKQELFKIPLFGKALSIGECIPIDRQHPEKNLQLFQLAKEKMQSGVALWIFPEGTRSRDGQLLAFKAGSMRLAQELGALIIPVAIKDTRYIAPAGTWEIACHQTVELRVGKPIDSLQFSGAEGIKHLTQNVQQAVQTLLTENLNGTIH